MHLRENCFLKFIKKKEGLTMDKKISIEELIAEWEGFYQDIFWIKTDFSNLQIPEKESGFNRLIIMAEGMTPQRLYDKCGEFFPCWKWTGDSLDNVVVYSERTSKNGAYAVWVRDCAEADEELKNFSADRVREEGLTTETLAERLVHEIKYFRESGGHHLDVKNITLCTGSRYSFGSVPYVRWYYGDRLRVSGFYSGDAYDSLRPRRVVS
ncbi:MAG: hypothetical protein A3I88_00685 [Candidatus Portnoybacteria bacterium RIFCSPLOWO2_12_FULL_39_9]|uniref:Uncharacterized protein n=1 Tax=Candidatus Portnoybacteria bacterium RIFCSPHIGHO2_12_FULL_38_9 TaxID=1801997 RepID=A0A1G2FEG8_9BACT|nr:MAG: hypothetical protein A3H00_01325 [Candidatus Portnoybacteria bacterium RBG_13_40_8]OGZ36466.1 MAG: hypothetical protein A3J64_02460 [Candidatus Portnoybacteria bacterium RIFCSPHIGHO2_12_FULL_38_9]OGZ39037.1 MAG: hypothetical protein A3F21_01085 [Candidatus Portnoybacteria bacterium RIFCSPLOWO2_01_FULL_38_39]OGZ41242.1 MAG: hypothetical protein A3I88_00685 [Candidatus Portnoybacteria bacterium RIFCSPLOWO2_12_FULL_39_9]